MIKTFKHGDETQISPHFKACEFQCKCGAGHDFQLDTDLVDYMEQLFVAIPKLFGIKVKSITVSSGFRCPDHDRSPSVGGSGTGQHTLGRAADFVCNGEDGKPIVSYLVCCAMQDIGFRGIARINDYYTHGDDRASGKWYGDETKGNSTVTDDFYKYYNVQKEAKPMMNGIDVSAHQGKIDWTKVQTDFAILRAGYGKEISQKDAQFEANYAGAKAADIPVGVYWYSYAMTPEEAQKEAEVCLEVINGKQFGYPIYFDVEEEKQLKLGKEKVSAIILAFLEKVEAAGYWVGLYMSASPLSDLVTDSIKNRFAVWVANVDVSKPSYSGAYGMWQYSWKGKLDGISGDVDLDHCYTDYPAQIKAKGLNGYGKQIEKPPETVTDSITVEMTVNGKKYSGTLTAK